MMYAWGEADHVVYAGKRVISTLLGPGDTCAFLSNMFSASSSFFAE